MDWSDLSPWPNWIEPVRSASNGSAENDRSENGSVRPVNLDRLLGQVEHEPGGPEQVNPTPSTSVCLTQSTMVNPNRMGLGVNQIWWVRPDPIVMIHQSGGWHQQVSMRMSRCMKGRARGRAWSVTHIRVHVGAHASTWICLFGPTHSPRALVARGGSVQALTKCRIFVNFTQFLWNWILDLLDKSFGCLTYGSSIMNCWNYYVQ